MKRKVTYQIEDRILDQVREAVEGGAAPNMSEFVQSALASHVQEIRKARVQASLQQAAVDPMVHEDIREIDQGFDPTVSEGLS